jgi:hypothetical protein
MKSLAVMRPAMGAGIVALVCACSGAWAGTFSATYLFNTPTDAPTLEGASFSSFTRIGVTEASQAGAFASGGWSEGTSQDPNQYVQFTLTPITGNLLTLTSLSFDVWSKNSAVGPKSGLVEILGSESFSQSFNISATQTSVSFDFADFTGTDGQGITVRFYGWGSLNKNQGELDFDNVTINGALNPVPEPVNIALIAFGLCFAGTAASRKLRSRTKPQR